MPSGSARVLAAFSRLLVKRPLDAEPFDLARARRAMAGRRNLPAALPRGLRVEPSRAPALPGEWLVPRGAQGDGAVLFLHGGGYFGGSVRSHRPLAAWLAREAGVRVFSLEYRLAPEHPFPAALDDARTAVGAILAEGIAPARLALAGDSAGAGLALATLLARRDAHAPPLAGAVLFCPLTDLAGTGESLVRNAHADAVLGTRHRARTAAMYAGAHPVEHPLISPHYASLAALPPLFVQASRHEALWDDARRLAERARAAGVAVTLDAEDGLAHDWQVSVPWTPESRRSVRRAGAFLAGAIAPGPAARS